MPGAEAVTADINRFIYFVNGRPEQPAGGTGVKKAAPEGALIMLHLQHAQMRALIQIVLKYKSYLNP